jgi:sterol desaturase/sphingolipid hydroxylase (fatty acid hydroxylase superfamily)
MIKKLAHSLTFSVAYLSSAVTVFAQERIDPFANNFPGPDPRTPLQVIITNAITIVFTVASLLTLAYLIWGSLKWITSGGDKEALKSAKGMITHALIGLGMLALSFVILRVVANILGFDLGNLILPPLDQVIARPTR